MSCLRLCTANCGVPMNIIRRFCFVFMLFLCVVLCGLLCGVCVVVYSSDRSAIVFR